jgi:hypothetical protein
MKRISNFFCCYPDKSATKEAIIKKESDILRLKESNHSSISKHDLHIYQIESNIQYAAGNNVNNANTLSENGRRITNHSSISKEDDNLCIPPTNDDIFGHLKFLQSRSQNRSSLSRCSSLSAPELIQSRTSLLSTPSLEEPFLKASSTEALDNHTFLNGTELADKFPVVIISDETLTEKQIKESWVNFP